MTTRRQRWGPLALVGLVVLVQAALFVKLFRGGEPGGDDMSTHLSEIAGIARGLHAGDWNGLWNDSANLGFASGWYYQLAPQLLCATVATLFGGALSLLTIFKLSIAAPVVLLPITTYRGLRVAGLPPWYAAAGASTIGFVFADSYWGTGLDSVFAAGVYTQVWALLFYPLALAHGWRYLSTGRGAGHATAYALIVGMCHPFVAFCLAPALAVTPWWCAGWRRALSRAGALFALALAAAAWEWVPILVRHDSFGGFPVRVASEAGPGPVRTLWEIVNGRSLDARHTVPLLTLFVGAGVLAVGWHLTERAEPKVTAEPRGHKWWKRRPLGDRLGVLAILLAQGLLFATLLALGKVVGKTKGDLVPAVRFFPLMQITLAVAAGVAAAWLYELARPKLPAPGLPWIAAGTLATLVGLATPPLWHRIHTVEDYHVHRDQLTEVLAFLSSAPPGRVMADKELGTGSHWWLYLPYAYADHPALRAFGGAALQSSTNYVFLRTGDAFDHWRLYGARWALTDAKTTPRWPEATLAFSTDDYRVWELPYDGMIAPMRISDVVPTRDHETRKRKAFRWLEGKGPETATYWAFEDATIPPSDAPRGTVAAQTHAPSRYDADVVVPGPEVGDFVLKVTYHPDWHATIDGQPAHILRVTPDLMALEVPPGDHHVAFRFRRPWWISALLALTAVELALLAVRARRLTARTATATPA